MGREKGRGGEKHLEERGRIGRMREQGDRKNRKKER